MRFTNACSATFRNECRDPAVRDPRGRGWRHGPCRDTDLSGLVPLEAPVPFVAYSRNSTEYTWTIHSGTPVCENASIEITCMAATKASAEAIADAVIAALGPANFMIAGRASLAPDPDNDLVATTINVTKFS